MNRPVNIFISYAPEDILYKEALVRHLASLRRTEKVSLWSDSQISPGVEWSEETREHLRRADIVALLISNDFMNSDHIWDHELKESLARRDKGEAVMLIPIMVRPCVVKNTVLEKIQRLPRNAEAITSLPNQDHVWTQISVEIGAIVDNFQKTVYAAAESSLLQVSTKQEQQVIGNKNIITGSIIIVGRDFNIGDTYGGTNTIAGSKRKNNEKAGIIPDVNLEYLIKGYLDSIPQRPIVVEEKSNHPIEIRNTFIGGQHQHVAPAAEGYQTFSGTKDEYDRIIQLLSALNTEDKDFLKREVQYPGSSIQEREKIGSKILHSLQKSMNWLNSNSEDILKNVTASMYFEAAKLFFGF